RFARRRLLTGSALLGAASLGAAATLLGGCKRAETCPPAQLAAEDQKLRLTPHYTERPPDPEKLCSGRQQYPPDTDPRAAGCKLIKGPIHPAGYCAAFTSKS